ncbi:threonine synthase [Buchnera aphidicola]|uniref:threonine synthase n=1 Tax=Buchnera aphidicola TaxID=9 RepID=UPI0030EC6DE9
MKLYNLKKTKEIVNFSKAVKLGLGSNQGLFFPNTIPKISKKKLKKLLKMNFIDRSYKILSMFIKSEISKKNLKKIVSTSFSFTKPKLKNIVKKISCLELFHGPTLAFKDFGARFMAQTLFYLNKKNHPITILTATSGDTGAAVAHAFYKMKNIKVVILYPKGKISKLQEQLFCTLGENIQTISVNGTFDECQNLVKKSFQNSEIKKKTHLNSANSINISRLMAQICYYFEAFSLVPKKYRKKIIISVPCGNFGNLTAGLLSKSMGLPIKKFVLSTNSNNTVPRFLQTGYWNPHKTISTISNAMDISEPNNWIRVKEIFLKNNWNIKSLGYGSVSEKNTKKNLLELFKLNYISEPHAATAYKVLKKYKKKEFFGIFLGTAHCSKFQKTVEKVLNISIKLPKRLSKYSKKKIISKNIDPDFNELKKILLI